MPLPLPVCAACLTRNSFRACAAQKLPPIGPHIIRQFILLCSAPPHLYSPQSGLQLTVRLEDIRLLESRKSSRLSGQANTDFSKLADFNIVHERKRLNSEKSSDGSEFFG